MISRLIEQIGRTFNLRIELRIESLRLWIEKAEGRFSNYLLNYNKNKYDYFRRGSCKGCLFSGKDEKLLTEGKCYCIFNPRPEIVALKHKCGRIVKK